MIPQRKVTLLSRRADAFNVTDLMGEVVSRWVKNPMFINFVRKNPMTAEQIFDYGYSRVLFEPDRANDQIVKTPFAVLRERKGNCVDYSVLYATLLKLNGLGGHFRSVSFDPKNLKPIHIYVISGAGEILDAVQGQDQEGEKSFVDRENKYGRFNQEVKYIIKFDTLY